MILLATKFTVRFIFSNFFQIFNVNLIVRHANLKNISHVGVNNNTQNIILISV